jgi:hypothetical protein
MAKMTCRCRNTLHDGSSKDIRLFIYSEWDSELISELINSYDTKLRFAPHPKNDVWRCPECERLYFFDGNEIIKVYALEPEPQSETPGGNQK